MIWLMLVTLVVVFVIGFRVLNSRARRALRALTKRLNIDPVYVESLVSLMGKEASDEFVEYLSRETEAHLANAASVLFIYQSLSWMNPKRASLSGAAFCVKPICRRSCRLNMSGWRSIFCASWSRMPTKCRHFATVITSVSRRRRPQ